MRYRSKLILGFATLALLVSIGLGIIVFRTSTEYENRAQKNSLLVSARSYVAQMEEELDQMNAIIYYILSDANMLENITLLRNLEEIKIPDYYIQKAKAEIQVGITTEFIMKNSYRTVFFNQSGFMASSAVYTLNMIDAYNQRLNKDYSIEEIPYLEPAIAANGKSVISVPHDDRWGAYENERVFSMIKQIRGDGMGYLEVENKLETLDELKQIDPDVQFLLVLGKDQLLYASDDDYPASITDEDQKLINSIEDHEVIPTNNGLYVMVSSDDYDFRVLASKSTAIIEAGRERLFITAFMVALVVFTIALVIVVISSFILTRPVKQLQKMVESTNIENLQTFKEMTVSSRGLDEFTELMRSYMAMTKRLNQALVNEKRSSMLQLQAQFDTLQTQVNPHFIYNVLNIISSRAVLADDEVICEMCGALGSMLRYSTNNKQRYAKVRDELEYLGHYFYLLQERYENRLQVLIDVDDATKEQIIPKMTLQQIVENSIKHGFHDSDEEMIIELKGVMTDSCWMIKVRDNGSGMTPERLMEVRQRLDKVSMDLMDMEVPTEAEIGGIGLTNTYARCLLLYQKELIFELCNRSDQSGVDVIVGKKVNN